MNIEHVHLGYSDSGFIINFVRAYCSFGRMTVSDGPPAAPAPSVVTAPAVAGGAGSD